MSTLPLADPDDYTWRQAGDNSPLWQRRLCGAEVPIAELSNGIYVSSSAFTSALIDGKYSLQDVKRAARAAWRLLRYEEPHIAGNAVRDTHGRVLLQYRIPKDEEEVESWLDRTILVEASDKLPTALRDAYKEDRTRNSLGALEAASIYFVAAVPNMLTPLNGTRLRILFDGYSLFYDGIGFRYAVSHNKLDWNKSTDNLREACVKLLAPEQYVFGPISNENIKEMWTGRSPEFCIYPMLVAENPAKWGSSDTLFITFTKEQSETMATAVPQRLGPGYSIIHLGQAAFLLAQIKLKPDDIPDSSHWCCFTAINGRPYMQEPYKSYRKPYLPHCQIIGLVGFDELTNYVQRGHHTKAKTLELLIKAVKQSKDGYEKTCNLPHIMGMSVPIAEEICQGWSYGISQPMYACWGMDERYIPWHFKNDKEEKVISLADLCFWGDNYTPYPSVRLTCWRRAWRLAVDFNTSCFDEALMRTFVDEMASLMILFCSPGLDRGESSRGLTSQFRSTAPTGPSYQHALQDRVL
ncbi:MAG: hypothetical protein L6R36_000189 [Xanthoria steineri]|nr:MAG: hypothetical protein L6R36_000189 [Xanthoria steineri]